MGMYDDLRCERVMPDGFDGRAHSFQTKDMGCDMAMYEITPEGRLMQHLNADDDISGMFGGERVKWRDTHFHGWLNFYTFINTGPGEWHGYNAKFTDGQLVSIECDERTRSSIDSGRAKP
jgi:hypothetical protein